MSEDIRQRLIDIGCPPDVAEVIAHWDEREREARERLERLAQMDGPVVLRKVSE